MHTSLPVSHLNIFQDGPGSVRFGCGFGCGTVRAVPVFGSDGSSGERVFSAFQQQLKRARCSFGYGLGSRKTAPAVPVPP